MAGYIFIDEKAVDPDSHDEVHGVVQAASHGIPVSQGVGPDSSLKYRAKGSSRGALFGNARDVNGLTDSDSDSIRHESFHIIIEVFAELVKGTRKVRERSKTFVEEKTFREISDLALQRPKPPGQHLARDDFVYVPPVNEWIEPAHLSVYSVDKHPSPKPEGEGEFVLLYLFWSQSLSHRATNKSVGQDLRLELNQGRPIPDPKWYVSTTTTAIPDTDEILSLFFLPVIFKILTVAALYKGV